MQMTRWLGDGSTRIRTGINYHATVEYRWAKYETLQLFSALRLEGPPLVRPHACGCNTHKYSVKKKRRVKPR